MPSGVDKFGKPLTQLGDQLPQGKVSSNDKASRDKVSKDKRSWSTESEPDSPLDTPPVHQQSGARSISSSSSLTSIGGDDYDSESSPAEVESPASPEVQRKKKAEEGNAMQEQERQKLAVEDPLPPAVREQEQPQLRRKMPPRPKPITLLVADESATIQKLQAQLEEARKRADQAEAANKKLEEEKAEKLKEEAENKKLEEEKAITPQRQYKDWVDRLAHIDAEYQRKFQKKSKAEQDAINAKANFFAVQEMLRQQVAKKPGRLGALWSRIKTLWSPRVETTQYILDSRSKEVLCKREGYLLAGSKEDAQRLLEDNKNEAQYLLKSHHEKMQWLLESQLHWATEVVRSPKILPPEEKIRIFVQTIDSEKDAGVELNQANLEMRNALKDAREKIQPEYSALRTAQDNLSKLQVAAQQYEDTRPGFFSTLFKSGQSKLEQKKNEIMNQFRLQVEAVKGVFNLKTISEHEKFELYNQTRALLLKQQKNIRWYDPKKGRLTFDNLISRLDQIRESVEKTRQVEQKGKDEQPKVSGEHKKSTSATVTQGLATTFTETHINTAEIISRQLAELGKKIEGFKVLEEANRGNYTPSALFSLPPNFGRAPFEVVVQSDQKLSIIDRKKGQMIGVHESLAKLLENAKFMWNKKGAHNYKFIADLRFMRSFLHDLCLELKELQKPGKANPALQSALGKMVNTANDIQNIIYNLNKLNHPYAGLINECDETMEQIKMYLEKAGPKLTESGWANFIRLATSDDARSQEERKLFEEYDGSPRKLGFLLRHFPEPDCSRNLIGNSAKINALLPVYREAYLLKKKLLSYPPAKKITTSVETPLDEHRAPLKRAKAWAVRDFFAFRREYNSLTHTPQGFAWDTSEEKFTFSRYQGLLGTFPEYEIHLAVTPAKDDLLSQPLKSHRVRYESQMQTFMDSVAHDRCVDAQALEKEREITEVRPGRLGSMP